MPRSRKKKIALINVRDLNRFKSGDVVDAEALVEAGLVKGSFDGIKLLGNGDIDFPLTIRINSISSGARKKIEATGGTVEVA